jgi:hypothetical protein
MADLRRETTGQNVTISFIPGYLPVLGYTEVNGEQVPVKKSINDIVEALKTQVPGITEISIKGNKIIADVQDFDKTKSDNIREIVKSFVVPEELQATNPTAYEREKAKFEKFNINVLGLSKDVKAPATKEMTGEIAWFAFPIMENKPAVVDYIVNKIQAVSDPSKPEFNPLIPIYKVEYGAGNLVYVLAKKEESVYDYISSIGKMYYPIGQNTMNQMTPLKSVSEIAKAVGMHEANSFITRKFLSKNPNFLTDLINGKVGPGVAASFYDVLYNGLEKQNPNFVLLTVDANVTPKNFKANRPVYFKEERFILKHKKFVGNKRSDADSTIKEAVTKYRLEKGDLISENKDLDFSIIMHSITEFARTSDEGEFATSGNINKLEDRLILNEQTEEVGQLSLEDQTLNEELIDEMFNKFVERSAEEIVRNAPEILTDLTKIKMSKEQDKIKSAAEPFDVGKADLRIKEIERQLKQLSKETYEKQKNLESSQKTIDKDLSSMFSAFRFDQAPQLDNPALMSELNEYLVANGKGTFLQYTSNELEKDANIENFIKGFLIEKSNNSKAEIRNTINQLEASSNQMKEKLESEKNSISEKLYNPETVKKLEEEGETEEKEPEFYVESGISLDGSGIFVGQCYIYEGTEGSKGKLIKDLKFEINPISRESYTMDNIINEYGKAYILDEIKKALLKYSNSVIPIMNPESIGTYITFPIDVKLDSVDQLDTSITKKGRVRFIQQGLIALDKLEGILEQTGKSVENE